MTAGRGEPTTYAKLAAQHPCEIPNEAKQLVGTVMEDGQITIEIIQTRQGRGRVLEYVTLSRDSFNTWMHTMRGWWQDEKNHPLVPKRRPPMDSINTLRSPG